MCELKCLLDTGSWSAIIALKNGLLSLGLKNMVINTSIGSEERRVEEVKISLLEATGQVRNDRATTPAGRIGPDYLLHDQWYLTAFEQLGIPKGKRDLFDIPTEGDIDLLSGLNSVELLAQPPHYLQT